MKSDEIINYFKDFNNLVEYFSDMFNFKIIKCFSLLYNIKNYKNNTGFYIGISFLVFSITLLILYKIKGFKSLRKVFYHKLKDLSKEKEGGIEIGNKKKLMPTKGKYKHKNRTPSFHQNKNDENNINENQKNHRKSKENTNYYIDNTIKSLKTNDNILNINKTNKNDINVIMMNSNSINKELISHIKFNISQNILVENKDNYMSDKEKNELPYFKAILIDKRNFLKIFLSIFLSKIDLLENIFNPEEYSSRYLLFNIYLLSLNIDLLMNCLLYNDYAVSQKYHCNGNLQFITSFIISLLSNIFSFILLYFINYLANFSDIIEMIIKKIKSIKVYLSLLIKVLKRMEIKFYSLLVLEIILGLFMVYYLFVFSVIYSKSIYSFLLNYLYSQIESLFYSACVSIIISLLRRLSLLYNSKRLYIISIYINDHF